MLLLWLAGVSLSAQAQLTIDITEGVQGAAPIAVAPFAGEATAPLGAQQGFGDVIAADLARSGRFETLSLTVAGDIAAGAGADATPDYPRWRERGVDHVLLGDVAPAAANRVTVRFQLADVLQQRPLQRLSFTVDRGAARRLAHHIGDLVFQELTGVRGAFDTRIAYVTVSGRGAASRHALVVADSDGYAPRQVLSSPRPLLAPAWSPDGRRLAYVSFENRRAQIYAQDLFTGRRERLSAAPGINGAPAWSPDGRRLAVTLSRDGNPEIYVLELNAGGGVLRRLTDNLAIDTEPAWSPDGRSLVFTSNRSGSPQIYEVAASGGQARRLTFQGDYNANARYAPDGRRLVLVHRRQQRFHIALLDRDGDAGVLKVISAGGLDESPSFAPNGQMVIFAASDSGRGVLMVTAVDGRGGHRLRFAGGDVQEPAWSPFRQ